uniref:Ubiquitin-like domain-containing protein n=1 Tax=Colletotrichum fructicola (strain Nara gc5) TaxID=1213859 RepID=L2GGZ3_COLFN
MRGLFGRGLPPLDHLELEASIIHGGYQLHSKKKPPVLAFEPKTLLRQLKRVLRKVGDTPGDQLIGLDAQFRLAVQNAPQRAQNKDGRVRNLIAVDTRGMPEFIVAYMSMEPALEPIHLTDSIGRTIVMPYEQCRTLKGARNIIHNRFRDIGRMWPMISQGAFEIVNEDDVVVTPAAWENTVKPGAVLTMRLSPFADSSVGPDSKTWAEQYMGPPPPPPGMYPPPPGFRPPPVFLEAPRGQAAAAWRLHQAGQGAHAPESSTLAPPPSVVATARLEEWKLGFELDFGGPEPTREKDMDEQTWNKLGRLVAQWTYATDTEFNTDSGTMPWYDDAATARSSSSGSSSSSSDEIVDD